MKKSSLMFIPSGGLANRMRAIASAYTLTQQTDSDLQVVWFQDWALNAPFHSIFKPNEQLYIREARGMDFLLYDRARRKNLWLPTLPQLMLFKRRIKEDEIGRLKQQNFDFALWLRGHRCYMSCFGLIKPVVNEVYRRLFAPVAAIAKVVDDYSEHFSAHTVGVHIRRTDHAVAIKNSPDYLFVKKLEWEIENHDDTRIFLATDSNEVKQAFVERFGNRVMMQEAEARRDTIEGIRKGLIDMYTLSKTCKIYGSAGSTFSPMAASLGDVKLEIVTKE